MKLTEWFPGHIKPVRPGVYQQLSAVDKTLGYQRWDGANWSSWYSTVEGAAKATDVAAHPFQNDQWRGLAEKP